MHSTTHLLLLLLQNAEGQVEYNNGTFTFKPNNQDIKNLENLGLLQQNSRKLTAYGKTYRPVTDPNKLSNSGLNRMIKGGLEVATRKLKYGKFTAQDATLEAIANFVDVSNSALVSNEEYLNNFSEAPEDLGEGVQAAVEILENVQEVEKVEEVKVKRGRKKKTEV
jgi:HKD family nuclease